MVDHCGFDDHHQDDHRLQAHHVVLQHRPRPLRYLDGLGVSESQDKVDAEIETYLGFALIGRELYSDATPAILPCTERSY